MNTDVYHTFYIMLNDVWNPIFSYCCNYLYLLHCNRNGNEFGKMYKKDNCRKFPCVFMCLRTVLWSETGTENVDATTDDKWMKQKGEFRSFPRPGFVNGNRYGLALRNNFNNWMKGRYIFISLMELNATSVLWNFIFLFTCISSSVQNAIIGVKKCFSNPFHRQLGMHSLGKPAIGTWGYKCVYLPHFLFDLSLYIV